MNQSIVIDASATLAWAFDENDLQTVFHPLLLESTLTAPALWTLELANVLVVKQRRKLFTNEDLQVLLVSLNGLGVACEPTNATMPELVGLAQQHTLSSYDAAYLDLAIETARPLLTTDRALARAAKASNVKLLWDPTH